MWRPSAIQIRTGLLWLAIGLSLLIALMAAFTPIFGHARWVLLGAQAFGMVLTGVPAFRNMRKNTSRHFLCFAFFEIFATFSAPFWSWNTAILLFVAAYFLWMAFQPPRDTRHQA